MRGFRVAALLIGLTATRLSAKSPTAKIIVMGGGLAQMVELTDTALTRMSDVFVGNFIDSTRGVAPTPPGLARYEVDFYLPDNRPSLFVRWFRRPTLYRAYVVYFAADGKGGYVLVPGDGDPWADWNRGTIVRPTLEGHWSYATPEWGRRIANAIAHARRLPPPTCPTDQMSPSDESYADAKQLAELLEREGLHIRCFYNSTSQGMLGERHAAAMATDLGYFSALFFPAPSGAESITITSAVRNGQMVTVLHGPNRERPVDTLIGGSPAGFIVHKRWFIDDWGQPALDSALRSAVRKF